METRLSYIVTKKDGTKEIRFEQVKEKVQRMFAHKARNKKKC